MTPVVAEARRWIGTPYVHQASVCQVGTDCLGLIRGIWRCLHGDEPETPPAYSADWSDLNKVDPLRAAMARHLEPVDDRCLRSGDVLLFRMGGGAAAKHLGVCGEADTDPTFIHAYARHGVVESPLAAPWVRRIVARFAFQRG